MISKAAAAGLLLRGGVVASYGGMGMEEMNGMDGMAAAGITGVGFIDAALNWVLSLPGWLSASLIAAAVLLAAAFAGWVLGRIYLSVRYPNPEKPQYLSPLQKVAVLVVGVAVVVILMRSLLPEPPEEVTDDPSMGMDMEAGEPVDGDPIEGDFSEEDLSEGDLPEEDLTEGDLAGDTPAEEPAEDSAGGGAVATPDAGNAVIRPMPARPRGGGGGSVRIG